MAAMPGGGAGGRRADDRLRRDGRASGWAGVNRFTGSYALEGATLTIGPLAMTRMAGPPERMEQESPPRGRPRGRRSRWRRRTGRSCSSGGRGRAAPGARLHRFTTAMATSSVRRPPHQVARGGVDRRGRAGPASRRVAARSASRRPSSPNSRLAVPRLDDAVGVEHQQVARARRASTWSRKACPGRSRRAGRDRPAPASRPALVDHQRRRVAGAAPAQLAGVRRR